MNSKNNKGIKIVGGSLLTLAIVALLSITYANYTATLKITGAGTVKAAKWNIEFDPTVETTSTEGKEVSAGDVSVDGAALSISNAELKRPGDKITYDFQVKNKGDFDAILSNANINLTCKTANEETDKTSDFCKKYLTIELYSTEDSDTKLAYIDNAYTKSDATSHVITEKGDTEKFKLVITYKNAEGTDTSGQTLATEDIKITEFGATLNYAQK